MPRHLLGKKQVKNGLVYFKNNMEEKTKDMNRMDHSRSMARGCQQGYHSFSDDRTELKALSNGMTVMIMKCIICNRNIEKVAELNINDLVEKYEKDDSQNSPNLKHNLQNEETEENSEILNKILGK